MFAFFYSVVLRLIILAIACNKRSVRTRPKPQTACKRFFRRRTKPQTASKKPFRRRPKP